VDNTKWYLYIYRTIIILGHT